MLVCMHAMLQCAWAHILDQLDQIRVLEVSTEIGGQASEKYVKACACNQAQTSMHTCYFYTLKHLLLKI